MKKNPSNLPAKAGPGVAFQYGGVDVMLNDERLVCLTDMYKSVGSPKSKSPKHWLQTDLAGGFVAEVAAKYKVTRDDLIVTRRGKGVSGTWGHWQVATAYAKYLSHEYHIYVNEAFREWSEEKANPALKAERAIAAYEQRGRLREWIDRRMKGIGTRVALCSTMAEHNCKKNGIADNPYAEATRSISLQVLGKTPSEIKEEKGLTKSASTRDHLEVEDLISIEWAEIQARKLIKEEGADGNKECVEMCRRAGAAVKAAIKALAKPAIVLWGFFGGSGCVQVNSPLWESQPPLLIDRGCPQGGQVTYGTPEAEPTAMPGEIVPRLSPPEPEVVPRETSGAPGRRVFAGR